MTITARAATAGELVYFRTAGQKSSLYLAILPDLSIYTARVNGAPSSTDQLGQITYDTGSGTLANVKDGMTLMVGSSAGAYDKGLARIRKTPTATIFYIGEESELDIEDDDYLTVINDFGIWAKHIIAEADLTLMDYDIEYSDQNEDLNPVPVMGMHAISKLTGADVTHSRDGADSWVLGSTISSYAWTISGPVGATIVVLNPTTATPSFTTDTEGWYRIGLTVTAANAKTATGYRWWYVYSDTEPPVKSFQLGRCEGSAEAGGWSFEVEMVDEAGLSSVRDRALVILFREDWYGATNVSIGPETGYENIETWGWIEGESITWNAEQTRVSFTVRGPQWWISQVEGFPTGVKHPTSGQTGWAWMPDLTVDRGIFHHLYWRSTVMNVIDVQLSGDARLASAIEGPLANLWEQLVAMSDLTILARPRCDRYGRLFVEIDSQFLPVADRSTIPVVQTLTTVDWQPDIDIRRVTVSPVSMVDLSGVAFDGTTATPFLARSPGRVFKRHGRVEPKDHLLLVDQANANSLAGLILGQLNNKYPSIPITLSSNQSLIDIAPQQYLQISIAAGDTIRGIAETNMKLIPRTVSREHDPKTGVLITKLECEAETFPELSVTVVKPQPPVIGIPDPPTIPIWPITPIGPPTAPPPWNPTPPPTITCIGDTAAPPNGPWQQWLDQRGLIIANAEALPYVTFNPATIGGPYSIYVRSNAFTNKTKMLLDGYFEQSDDDGVTWQTWVDNDGLTGRVFSSGVPYEADMSIFSGSRHDQRGGILTPGTVLFMGGADYWEWRLDPGPETVPGGPAILTQSIVGGYNDGFTPGGSHSEAFGSDAWNWSLNVDRYWSYAIWHLDMQGLSFPNGHLYITIQVNSGSGSPTIKQMRTTSFKSGGTPSLSEDTGGITLPGAGNTGILTPSVSTNLTFQDGYFSIDTGKNGVAAADVDIIKIEWRETNGTLHDLWEPVLRIKRVRINDGYVYNICTE